MTLLFSKSFISSLVFATGLWAYTSLNQEYRTNISIPLMIKLPSTRAFEEAAPENLTLTIKGSGWQIFNLFFNSSAVCDIDLSHAKINDTIYEISRDNILKNIQFLNFVQPIEIIPDNILINTGKIGEYNVALRSKVIVIPRSGYTMVGNVQLTPDLITIKGNDGIAHDIQKWSTAETYFEDVIKPISTSIELSDTLSGIINVFPKNVKVNIDIQQIAELVIPDIRIKIRGATSLRNHSIEPLLLTVTVRGGIEVLKQMQLESVTAFVEYQNIISDSSGVIVPEIKVPENVSVINVSPPYIYHKIKI